MTAFRLTLDLDEQTRARWQAAAQRYGWTVDEWVRDVCATASDPDAGQIVDPCARLTTAEQEREQLREFLAIADGRAGTEHTNRVLAENDRDLKAQLMERYVDDLEAAEARVEALEVALREIGEHGIHGHAPGGKCGPCVARAALACPPRLGFNPEPMQVVERRDDVTGVDAIRGRSRDDRLRVWLALGGTEDNFPVAACPPQQRGEK